MSLSLLTDPAAVDAAIDEYDALGGETFRKQYGYGKARNLFVIRRGTLYDSKAIAGVAVGKQHPERGPLKSEEFSGGDQTVRKTLEGLGFDVWSSDETAPFDSTEALELIRAALGGEAALTQYLAVWPTPVGRTLALQLGQASVRIWTEIAPPEGMGSSKHYGAADSRHSSLSANAPSLAQPHAAWLTVVESRAALETLIAWYAQAPISTLNLAGLEQLKAVFKSAMTGFSTFEEAGSFYDDQERRYKDELAALFHAEVLPATGSDLDDHAAGALAGAYYGVLTRKLPSLNGPQNLINWQAVDRLKPSDEARSAKLGQALNALLRDHATASERLDVFIHDAGEIFRLNGATGPLGIARLLGSCALMLADPASFIAIRTDVFERAMKALKGEKFPSYSDEPGRVRAALSLTEEVRDHLDADGWRPRDLIDIQTFLWVALMYQSEPQEEATFAKAAEAFLARFREVRETPFKTVPDLWETMGRLKTTLEKTPSVADRPTVKVDWSLGKGVWASVPWIALMDERETTSTQKGLYIVFLVSRDLSTAHLCLLQGTTELVQEHKTSGALPILRQRSDAYRALAPELAQHGFLLDGEMNLGAEGWRAQSYEASCIAHHPLSAEALPNDAELDALLEPLLAAYHRILEQAPKPAVDDSAPTLPPYTVEDALAGLFIDPDEFRRTLDIWRDKKNLVLQGAPGVGKSYIARRLAYALMAQKDPSRVEVVQFHQSYGYEDFVQGYRPTADGGFELRDGVFHRFCEQARKRPGVPHVFIIDEINRGNLSKIFGELLLLIEHDKRAAEWAARLAYASEDTEPFHVPENIWLLGMMNTADRSLSVVDYALRRRFAFITLTPGFTSPAFATHLADRGASPEVITAVIQGMQELNAAIGEDRVNLGPGFQIGHSFFTPADGQTLGRAWFERVVESEIRPLLDEYWFDAPDRADEWRTRLLSHL